MIASRPASAAFRTGARYDRGRGRAYYYYYYDFYY